jgi:hypothetical protein
MVEETVKVRLAGLEVDTLTSFIQLTLSCGICTNLFNNRARKPMHLSCQHVYCQSCWAHHHEAQNMGRKVACPSCRVEASFSKLKKSGPLCRQLDAVMSDKRLPAETAELLFRDVEEEPLQPEEESPYSPVYEPSSPAYGPSSPVYDPYASSPVYEPSSTAYDWLSSPQHDASPLPVPE